MSLLPSPGAPQRPEETRNLLLAVAFSTLILLGWQYFYEAPRRQQEAARLQQQATSQRVDPSQTLQAAPAEITGNTEPLTRDKALAQSDRIAIRSPELKGTIRLEGARFDDLILSRYRQTVDRDSSPVVLLAPGITQSGYFAEFGWLSADTQTPTASTPWQTRDTELTPERPVTLFWVNPDGVRFELEIALDEHFMFTVKQRVLNTEERPVSVTPYGFINRKLASESEHFAILHEGPLGVVNGALEEVSYEDLREEGEFRFPKAEGWLGITDKYWLTAFAPEGAEPFSMRFHTYQTGGEQRYQIDYQRPAFRLEPGSQNEQTTRLFAGAKHVKLLDAYGERYSIPLFDRAVDFGVLYFLTKPIFHLLHFFHTLLGNFGLAILTLTVIIRGLMYPLASKSFYSMAQMRHLVPKMNEIRERHKDDRLRMNQEIMEMYKREKVNPASGCLPMLVQIPVFFALYKVLFVTIEMRHAPFYGWIRDLSAPDPTNLFTLFGLVPWDPPSFLHLGILPIAMTATMVIQQRLNPKPNDPVQAQIMTLMPYMFLFLFASFPAGLVVYWVWSNILSILQQYIITRRYEKRTGDMSYRRKPKAKTA